jgi:hypothetical protein
MGTAITTFGTSDILLLTYPQGAISWSFRSALCDRLSRICYCLLGVGRSLGTKQVVVRALSRTLNGVL